MCGRVRATATLGELLDRFGFARVRDPGLAELPKRWNGTPGELYPIITQTRGDDGIIDQFVEARWGFQPAWAVEKGYAPKVNARAENIAGGKLFGSAYRFRRGLMPIQGYFEWQGPKGAKNRPPYAIAMKDGSDFCLGVVWDESYGNTTFAVITTAPNALMRRIHDRMPLILHERDYARWLSEEPDPRDLMVPFPAELMKAWPISTRVNNAKGNNDPDVLRPIGPELE